MKLSIRIRRYAPSVRFADLWLIDGAGKVESCHGYATIDAASVEKVAVAFREIGMAVEIEERPTVTFADEEKLEASREVGKQKLLF